MRTHTLLRIASAAAVYAEAPLPDWARRQLAHTPWVVVRRACARGTDIPVGVRGATRGERCAAWVNPTSVCTSVSPLELAARRDWRSHPRRAELPALSALDAVESIMAAARLAERWGPAGSVGFELASGYAAVGPQSDLDIILQLEAPLTRAVACALGMQLRQLPVRTDVLLETADGGLALCEYIRGRPPFLLRTATGPQLTSA